MRKDVCIDGHERSNIMEDCKNFLQKIKEFKPYIIDFEENGTMESKIYLSNWVVDGNNWRSIIIITYDKYISLANNKI